LSFSGRVPAYLQRLAGALDHWLPPSAA
jgi:hypothetical protein